MLNQNQLKQIQRIGLSQDRITELERLTHWKWYQHANGSNMRFRLAHGRGWSFVIWLAADGHARVGVYADVNKEGVQREFKKRLGDWAPIGLSISPDAYDNPGLNATKGVVGSMHFERQLNLGDDVDVKYVRQKVSDIQTRAVICDTFKDMEMTQISLREIAQGCTDEVRELRLRAEAGDAQSQYDLGIHYYRGDGVARDWSLYEKFMRDAANQGLNAAKGEVRFIESCMQVIPG